MDFTDRDKIAEKVDATFKKVVRLFAKNNVSVTEIYEVMPLLLASTTAHLQSMGKINKNPEDVLQMLVKTTLTLLQVETQPLEKNKVN